MSPPSRRLARLAPRLADARAFASGAGKDVARRDASDVASSSSSSSDANPWRPVVDRETRRVYFWNVRTGATTAIGAPRPTTEFLADDAPSAREGIGTQIGSAFAMGAGASFGFAAVAVAARIAFG
jgi:hypothetical protein